MELKQIFQITFSGDENILCGNLVAETECVLLSTSGQVFKWNFAENKGQHLFSVTSGFSYSDGGFDLTAKCAIYTMDDIVVVVNEFKTHGFAYSPKLGHTVHLWRKDYHAEISSFPIALFKDETGSPHLIYAVDWNHLQVMNLDTLQILTADKSLIAVGAEQQHLDAYSKWQLPKNQNPWPGEYDYFFGQLLISPEANRFLSRGWAWGSSDYYKAFELQHFINEKRILDESVMGGEHCNRAACWIDENTIAVVYSPNHDDGDSYVADAYTNLNIYQYKEGKWNEIRNFELNVFDGLGGELYFNVEMNVFVAFAKNKGLTICTADGKILLREPTFLPVNYNSQWNAFLAIEGKMVSAFKLIN